MTFIWDMNKQRKIRKSHITYCKIVGGVIRDYPCKYVNAIIHKDEITIAGPFENEQIAREWINKNFK